MGVTLFYNTECPDCARRARRTARLDWLRRVRISTDDSPMGPVSLGPTGFCSTPTRPADRRSWQTGLQW